MCPDAEPLRSKGASLTHAGSSQPEAPQAPVPGPSIGSRGSSLRPRQILLGLAVILACLLPFSGKPIHMDDPLFLWSAQRIQHHPLDPYGFEINWYGRRMPMHEVAKNPPGAAYYLAAAAGLLGWSARGLHLAFLLPALCCGWGVFVLARRLTRRPLVALLATVLTPGFLVSGSTLMCDTLMLAFWLGSIALWDQGLRDEDARKLGAASLLAALCALVKYFGIALLPLLAVHAALRRRRPSLWAPPLLLPLAVLTGYQIWTHATYGRGLLLDAAAYATGWRAENPAPLVHHVFTGLSFAGGCAASLLFLSPLLLRRRQAAVWLAAVVLGACALWRVPGLERGLFGFEIDGAGVAAQLALWTSAGIGLLVLAAADLRASRRPEAVLLLLWTLGTFVFASFVNWTVNARSVLPLIPAAGILLARGVERRTAGRPEQPTASAEPASREPELTAGAADLATGAANLATGPAEFATGPAGLASPGWGRGRNRGLAAAWVASALLALTVTWSDSRLAGAGRQAAEEIFGAASGDAGGTSEGAGNSEGAGTNDGTGGTVSNDGTASDNGAGSDDGASRTVWFQGHWGFQYYAQRFGGEPVDFDHLSLRKDDLLVMPVYNTNVRGRPPGAEPYRKVEIPVAGWVSTMRSSAGAGFYSAIYGPLPFAFGRITPELYLVYRISGDIGPQSGADWGPGLSGEDSRRRSPVTPP